MKTMLAKYEILNNISANGVEELKFIEKAGRTCYKSEDKISEDGNTAINFNKMLVNRNHEAMLEHSFLSVKFYIDRGCCYDDKTKVLTKKGWKYFKDCNISDEFLSLDDDNNPVYVKAKQIISLDYCGSMHHWNTTQIDLMVTPNHNMWVFDYNKRKEETRTWKFLKSEDCNNSRYKFYKSSNRTSANDIDTFTIGPTVVRRGNHNQLYDALCFDANTFLELLGWWVTDGSISSGKGANGEGTSGNRVVISQVKKSGRERIKTLIDQLSLNYYEDEKGYRINSPQLFQFLKTNFIKGEDYRKTYYLSLPRWFFNLGNNNIKAFLKGVVGGDGTRITNSKSYQIYTKSNHFAEDLVELYMLIGECANIRTIKPRERVFPNGKHYLCGEQYVVSEVSTIETIVLKNRIKNFETYYKGKVYCAELEKYHKLYVMRNGKACWCGNSHEFVRHREASFAQESTRYCSYDKDKFGNEITFIDIVPGIGLDSKMKNMTDEQIGQVLDIWYAAMKCAEDYYMQMIEAGATPQIARSVLPNSTKTELVITTNYREWRHILKLRTAKDAHPQIREVCLELLKELKEKIPVIFDDIAVDD